VLARSLLAVAMPAFSCSLIVSCAAVAILIGFVAGLIAFSLLDLRSSATCSGCTVKVGSGFLVAGLTAVKDFCGGRVVFLVAGFGVIVTGALTTGTGFGLAGSALMTVTGAIFFGFAGSG
jgi:hypothetical protein